MKSSLGRIVPCGQKLLGEVLKRGDLVVDLTAGTGQDTLALFRFVGDVGQVIAFDIQTMALDQTEALLEGAGACVRRNDTRQKLACCAGIDLIADSHEHLDCYVDQPPRGIIANLGYLPGGDQAIITQTETTLSTLRQAADLLAVGGRLVVAVYPGHPGGATEAEAVSDFFSNLADNLFQVLLLRVANRSHAPFLFVAEKLK